MNNINIPWSLKGVGPFLNKYGDKILFRGILNTPPIETNPNSETGIHTAVPHRYLLAYLAAMKSFLRYHQDVAVYTHDDGSLTPDDKDLIRSHIIGAKIINRSWADENFKSRIKDEFLSKIRESYTSYLKLFDPTLVSDKRNIIVLDTDVLFLREPSEIIGWMRSGGNAWYHRSQRWSNKDFKKSKVNITIGDGEGQSRVVHIQQAVTSDIDHLNHALGKEYCLVNGFNSGLVGYENGTVKYDELKTLFGYLFSKFGERIFRWGSEQTVHGLVLCGAGAKQLPWDKYMVYTKHNVDAASSATFVHFIGEFRFYRMLYPKLAMRVSRELRG